MKHANSNRPYKAIAEKIKEILNSGNYHINDRLMPERELAENLGVSRSIVREAIIMLEIQGYVEVKQGSGVYIIQLPNMEEENDNSLKSESSPFSMDIECGPFELLQARQILESQIASFAAINITKQEIVKLKETIEEDKLNLGQHIEDYEADETFHLTIAEASQNSILVETIKALWLLRNKSEMWAQLHKRILDKSYRTQWIDDHEKILFALQRRDPTGARDAMWQHLENVKQTLFKLSNVDDPEFDGFLFK
ncbi:FCD domain-containing protein [Thorsellia kenyensis]|uniref:FCD domain-containing protein n=1 Tax=Thorsellia kenyensis TaxID=1549888 RepID=A0ABV6CC77_9GAMM